MNLLNNLRVIFYTNIIVFESSFYCYSATCWSDLHETCMAVKVSGHMLSPTFNYSFKILLGFIGLWLCVTRPLF